MAAIRIVYSKDKDKNIIKKVEFWTAQDCWYFRSINGGALELLDIREHYWGDVPSWSTSTMRSAWGTSRA